MTDITRADLAFENGIGDAPVELWRVVSMRKWNDREIRHTNWFATEEGALTHAEWIKDGRGRLVGVNKFTLVTR